LIKKIPSQFWFPFWVDKWIFGSMRLEFDPDERSLWLDLLCLAAKDNGFIRANEETPYSLRQLAGLLIYDEAMVSSTLDKFIEKGKMTRDQNAVLYITNWETYCGSAAYRRKLKERYLSHKTCQPVTQSVSHNITQHNITNNNIKEIVPQIINYLNEKTGKKFSPKPEGTIKLIAGRLKEGHTLDDFKQVIDTKVAKWRGDPKMDDYLRPDTLFRPSNFDSYLNERIATIPVPVGKNVIAPSSKEIEYQKARAEFIKKHGDDKDKIAEFSQEWWSK
jgi:uncharacterized phage protein (TIGR02220 family)